MQHRDSLKREKFLLQADFVKLLVKERLPHLAATQANLS